MGGIVARPSDENVRNWRTGCAGTSSPASGKGRSAGLRPTLNPTMRGSCRAIDTGPMIDLPHGPSGLSKFQWSQDDFANMGWHDCRVHAVSVGEYDDDTLPPARLLLLFQVLTEREEKASVAIASNESSTGSPSAATSSRTGSDSYPLAHARQKLDESLNGRTERMRLIPPLTCFASASLERITRRRHRHQALLLNPNFAIDLMGMRPINQVHRAHDLPTHPATTSTRREPRQAAEDCRQHGDEG